MSDATLPPPRSSSVGPSSEGRVRSNSSQSQDEIDVSGGHSSDPVTGDGNSGESESRAEHKQRRKRTSPSDQAILEAEYKLNPKPSKAARAEIVDKVTLNEKEVQIWFQNRRQINRRKSRPLLPHEIAAFGLGGISTLSSDPAPFEGLLSSQASSGSSQTEAGINGQEESASSQEAEEHRDTRVEATRKIIPIKEKETVLKSILDAAFEPQSAAAGPGPDLGSFSITESVSKSFSSTPGYLANRWNNVNSSFSTPTLSETPLFSTPSVINPSQPSSCPERIGDSQNSAPSSQIRLSMSLDGKAELISDEPSPPRAIPPRPTSPAGVYWPQKKTRTLQRSQSALPFGPLARQAVAGAPFPRLPTGRSRDARSWEFCCDNEVRDELTAFAENESSGSAIAAISLLRSTSSSALKPNKNKRNAPAIKHDSTKQQGKKAKLSRTQSSLARLQNPEKHDKPSDTTGKDGLMRSPSGDSDKENWTPGDAPGTTHRRPLPSTRADKQGSLRAILGDNHNVPSHANLNAIGNRRRKGKVVEPQIFEDKENSGEVDADVERFMRGEISPSKKGDLDCVQGLLSLSQGNWR